MLLIDDHGTVRDGMRLHLSLQRAPVVGEADGGEAALQWLQGAAADALPDTVITDIAMRGMSGIAWPKRCTSATRSWPC